jgi:PAS domain-containing protein
MSLFKLQRFILTAILVLLVLISLFNLFFPGLLWSEEKHELMHIHHTFESFAAFAAILMAYLSLHIFSARYHKNYLFISAGFLIMGMMNLIHAFMDESVAFVFTHSVGMMGGGVFFALIWIPGVRWKRGALSYLFGAILLFSIVTAVLLYTSPHLFPSLSKDGHFTLSAKILNVAGGLLFIAAFVRLYLDFKKKQTIGFLILAAVALLSGFTGLKFPYSELWSNTWWFWHILKVVSYLFMLAFIISEYTRLLSERSAALKKVESQSIQLNSLFNGIEDIIYVADPETYKLLYVNEAAYKIWGDDIVGKKCFEILQSRNAPCPFCTNDKIMKNKGEPVVWEFQNEVSKDWYRCFDKAIQWEDGKWVRFEIAVNINNIKANEEKLLKTNKELQSFNKLAIGREKRIIEMKRRINKLSAELGRDEPYDLTFTGEN